MKLYVYFVAFLLFPQIYASPSLDSDCIKWFEKRKIQRDAKDCILKCAALKVDMGTFQCPDQCESLCSAKSEESLLGKFVLYPGLTPGEKQLVVKYPKQAYVVYKQKNITEQSTARNFPDQNLNDESDAFRHFLWAALVTKELGVSKAKEFLDAHEADPDQPSLERQMDEHNNTRGQAAARALIKEKNWSLKNIEAKGLEELRSKYLQVLKPDLLIPKEPR